MFETHFLHLQLLPTSVRASWNVQIQQTNAYFNLFRAKIRATRNIEAHGYFQNVNRPDWRNSSRISNLWASKTRTSLTEEYFNRTVNRQPGFRPGG